MVPAYDEMRDFCHSYILKLFSLYKISTELGVNIYRYVCIGCMIVRSVVPTVMH